MAFRKIDKGFVINSLSQLKKAGVDVTEYWGKSITSESVNMDSVYFINKHRPIPQFETLNYMYKQRNKGNKLFSWFMKENSTPDEMALALNSYVTRVIISSKYLSETDTREYAGIMMVESVLESLTSYISDGKTEQLTGAFTAIRDMLKEMFRKDG